LFLIEDTESKAPAADSYSWHFTSFSPDLGSPVVGECTFFHGFAIQCGGWAGFWWGFQIAISFRRLGSSCMFAENTEDKQLTKKVWFQSLNIMFFRSHRLFPLFFNRLQEKEENEEEGKKISNLDFSGEIMWKLQSLKKTIVYFMICAWCLEGEGVHSEFFCPQYGLFLHFTDSKSECPGYPSMRSGAGVSNDWCITTEPSRRWKWNPPEVRVTWSVQKLCNKSFYIVLQTSVRLF